MKYDAKTEKTYRKSQAPMICSRALRRPGPNGPVSALPPARHACSSSCASSRLHKKLAQAAYSIYCSKQIQCEGLVHPSLVIKYVPPVKALKTESMARSLVAPLPRIRCLKSSRSRLPAAEGQMAFKSQSSTASNVVCVVGVICV